MIGRDEETRKMLTADVGAPFARGCLARAEDKPLRANPYPSGTHDAQRWRSGWFWEDREIRNPE